MLSLCCPIGVAGARMMDAAVPRTEEDCVIPISRLS